MSKIRKTHHIKCWQHVHRTYSASSMAGGHNPLENSFLVFLKSQTDAYHTTLLFFSRYLPKGNKNICFPKRLACQYSELLYSQLANSHKHPKCPPSQWINTVAPSCNRVPSAIKISASLINNVHEYQKHHISRRSRTQTNIHFMTPLICGWRIGNSDLMIVRTVLPVGGGV